MTVDRFVQDRVGLIMYAVHRVEDHVVEGKEGCPPQLLTVVLPRVLLQVVLHRLVPEGGELDVEVVELGAPAFFRVKDLIAAGTTEFPLARLGLAERLPGRNVRSVAQILELQLAVVPALGLGEVVELGIRPVIALAVAARAKGCPEGVGVVR